MKRILALLLPLMLSTSAEARRPADPPPAPAPTPEAPASTPPAPAPLDPALAALRPLLGAWETLPSTAPEAPQGTFTLRADLGGQALLRRNTAQMPLGTHEDLLVIYPAGGGIRGFYVDNEGHYLHYDVTPTPTGAVLQSSGEGPRFRLTYALDAEGVLDIRFDVARPGGDFVPYLAGRARRTGP